MAGRKPSGDARTSTRPGRKARVVTRQTLRRKRDAEDHTITVPVLAPGADPGRTIPSPMAIRDRLVIDSRLVEDYDPGRLFAYDVTARDLVFLRGLASVGDRIVFRRGGRVAPDRICAVRTSSGVALARVEFQGHSLLLLPGEGMRDAKPLRLENFEGLAGAIAGTHVLLIRR